MEVDPPPKPDPPYGFVNQNEDMSNVPNRKRHVDDDKPSDNAVKKTAPYLSQPSIQAVYIHPFFSEGPKKYAKDDIEQIKMAEEESYAELDISDVVEDTDQYLESDYQSTNIIESELSELQDTEMVNSEEQIAGKKLVTHVANKPEVLRSTKLPLARIKSIMKMDPDVSVVNAEAVFLVTKATELFLETIAKETFTYTAQQKRKTIAKKDLDVVINKVDCLCFLEGAMDF